MLHNVKVRCKHIHNCLEIEAEFYCAAVIVDLELAKAGRTAAVGFLQENRRRLIPRLACANVTVRICLRVPIDRHASRRDDVHGVGGLVVE